MEEGEKKNSAKNKKKVDKKEKKEEWEELVIISNQVKAKQIMYIHVNNNSKGICLASWKSLRDYQRITSSEP